MPSLCPSCVHQPPSLNGFAENTWTQTTCALGRSKYTRNFPETYTSSVDVHSWHWGGWGERQGWAQIPALTSRFSGKCGHHRQPQVLPGTGGGCQRPQETTGMGNRSGFVKGSARRQHAHRQTWETRHCRDTGKKGTEISAPRWKKSINVENETARQKYIMSPTNHCATSLCLLFIM